MKNVMKTDTKGYGGGDKNRKASISLPGCYNEVWTTERTFTV